MALWKRLRALFSPEPTNRELAERIEALEATWRDTELELTGLTDKLSTQLKRMRQRAVDAGPQLSREDQISQAIRARRSARWQRPATSEEPE